MIRPTHWLVITINGQQLVIDLIHSFVDYYYLIVIGNYSLIDYRQELSTKLICLRSEVRAAKVDHLNLDTTTSTKFEYKYKQNFNTNTNTQKHKTQIQIHIQIQTQTQHLNTNTNTKFKYKYKQYTNNKLIT